MASVRGYTKNGTTKVNPMFLQKQRQIWRPSCRLNWMLRKRMMRPMIPMLPGRVVVMRVLMLALALMSQALLKAPRTAFPWCCRGHAVGGVRFSNTFFKHWDRPMLFVRQIATMPSACDLASL